MDHVDKVDVVGVFCGRGFMAAPHQIYALQFSPELFIPLENLDVK